MQIKLSNNKYNFLFKACFIGKYYIMTKFFMVNLIDKLFVSVCVFLTIFAWINFYTRSLWLSFVLGLVFSFACLFLLYYFINKKNEKKVKTKKQIEKMDLCFLSFRLMNNIEQLRLLVGILKLKNYEIKDGILLYAKDGKTCAIICATNLNIFTENDFLNIVKATKNLNVDYVEIVSQKFDSFNTKILKNIEYDLVSKEKLFKDFFEKENTFPDISELNTNIIKPKFIDLLSNIFIPSKAKSYFVCGLVLIFSSILLPYHTYYVC